MADPKLIVAIREAITEWALDVDIDAYGIYESLPDEFFPDMGDDEDSLIELIYDELDKMKVTVVWDE
jgi:hypothetical protein